MSDEIKAVDHELPKEPERAEIMIDRLKDMRLLISSHYQGLNKLDETNKITPALKQAKLAMIETRLWLGKLLGIFGNQYPYPESEKPNDIIHKMAEVSDTAFEIDPYDIKLIKELYKMYGDLAKIIFDEIVMLFAEGEKADLFAKFAYKSASYVRMWFGMRLAEIKEAENEVITDKVKAGVPVNNPDLKFPPSSDQD